MKASEFSTGESVIVTSLRERPLVIKTKEQEEKGEFSKFMVENSEHLTKVINKKQVTLSEVEGEFETVLFDGWVYFCDDGQAYYPGFEQNGEIHTLKSATDEEEGFYK